MIVLTDMKIRGMEDILITATDNLNGFTQTIRNVFPNQQCKSVLSIRSENSCRYVVWKDKWEYTTDMKDIYAAPTRRAAQAALQSFESKWDGKYGYAIKSWKELTVFFDFPIEIRQIIYTTNLLENLNGKIRKYTKKNYHSLQMTPY